MLSPTVRPFLGFLAFVGFYFVADLSQMFWFDLVLMTPRQFLSAG